MRAGLAGAVVLGSLLLSVGAPASPGLVHTAFVGVAGFCLVAIFGAIILHTDRPLAAAGRAAERLRNRITRGRRPPLYAAANVVALVPVTSGVLGRRHQRDGLVGQPPSGGELAAPGGQLGTGRLPPGAGASKSSG